MMLLAFYRAKRGNWYDKLVGWWTGGEFSHVEAVLLDLRDGNYLCATSSPRDGGIRLKIMPLPFDHWELISVNADNVAVGDWFAAHKGARYDWLGLLGFVLRRKLHDEQRWFCSEAVAAALGLPEPWRVCPNTLATLFSRPR